MGDRRRQRRSRRVPGQRHRPYPLGPVPLLRGVDHIDLMAATHVHEDHLCGLLPAAEKLPPAALWQTLPPEFCRSMRTLDIPAEGLTPSPEQVSPGPERLPPPLPGAELPAPPASGRNGAPAVPGSLGSGAGAPSRAQAEKLASSCRALYEEADPSAFWQRLDQLDAAMNNYSPDPPAGVPGGPGSYSPATPTTWAMEGWTPPPLRADLFKVGHHGQRDGISAEQIQAHRSPGGGVLRIQRPPLQQRRSGHPADDGGQRRTAVLFRLPARSGRRSPAPPSGPDVHSRRRRRNGGHIPVHPGLNPRSNTTYPSAPALHILPGAGRKKEENPAWLAVRQCGDLPQRRTGPGRP